LNKNIIIPVIESVIFFRRQGIVLQRHHYFGTLTTDNPVENYGNFTPLIHINATKRSSNESYQLARTKMHSIQAGKFKTKLSVLVTKLFYLKSLI